MYVLKGYGMLQGHFCIAWQKNCEERCPLQRLYFETTTPASATLRRFRLNSGESATVMRWVTQTQLLCDVTAQVSSERGHSNTSTTSKLSWNSKRCNDSVDSLLVGQLVVDAETVSISRAPDFLLEYGEIQLIWGTKRRLVERRRASAYVHCARMHGCIQIHIPLKIITIIISRSKHKSPRKLWLTSGQLTLDKLYASRGHVVRGHAAHTFKHDAWEKNKNKNIR